MPLHAADALILRTYKLGEADRIVVFLTADRGKRRGVAKGARRPKSRFSGGLEPLTRGRVAYFEQERRELVRLRYVEPVCSPLLSSDASALAHAGYFAELIDEWSAGGRSKRRRCFGWARRWSRRWRPRGRSTGSPANFEYWLLRLQGVYPSVERCGRCGGDLTAGARLSPGARALVCVACEPAGGGAPLSGAAVAFLRAARAAAPGALADVVLEGQAGQELAAAHRLLIRTHLEKDLKSLRVVREMTGDAAYTKETAR